MTTTKEPVTFRDKVTATAAKIKLAQAAPDLLAACELALDVLKNRDCPWTCGKLEGAIAKAKVQE